MTRLIALALTVAVIFVFFLFVSGGYFDLKVLATALFVGTVASVSAELICRILEILWW